MHHPSRRRRQAPDSAESAADGTNHAGAAVTDQAFPTGTLGLAAAEVMAVATAAVALATVNK